MHFNRQNIQILIVSSVISSSILSCGSDRINIEFKTSREIYIDDSKTDPDKLNKELEYDIREAEKNRRQKEHEAEAASKAKAETEKKSKSEQKTQEQTAKEETTQSKTSEEPVPQQ